MTDELPEVSDPIAVLIVDDSPVMRRLIARALGIAGLPIAEVYEAADGLAALHCLWKHPIDLLLCDLHMPEMGGLELLRVLSESGIVKRVPTIVVSSNHGEAPNAEALALGVRAYVHKPFQPERIGRVVREVLGRFPKP